MPADQQQIDFQARQGMFALALGAQLARARRAQHRDRHSLAREAGVSMQSIACYEQGTRTLSVGRFATLCLLLHQSPEHVLTQAMHHTLHRRHEDRLCVDLALLAETTDPHLAPLRRWAGVRASHTPAGRAAIAELDSTALTALATLAGTSPDQLQRALATVIDKG